MQLTKNNDNLFLSQIAFLILYCTYFWQLAMREACKYVEEKLAVKVMIPGLWPAYYADLSATYEVVHLNANLAGIIFEMWNIPCRPYEKRTFSEIYEY